MAFNIVIYMHQFLYLYLFAEYASNVDFQVVIRLPEEVFGDQDKSVYSVISQNNYMYLLYEH